MYKSRNTIICSGLSVFNVLILPVLLSFASVATAQNASNDTVAVHQLDNFVVEASNQKTSSRISTYIPLARQKNAAADAIALLKQMAIPQIDVDPISKAVRTASGQNVPIFIGFLPATIQDLQGMRTQLGHDDSLDPIFHNSMQYSGRQYIL